MKEISGGNKMSKELKIIKSAIQRLRDEMVGCPEAQKAIQKAFPEAFEKKEEWEDITSEVKVYLENRKDGYRLFMDDGDGNYFALSQGDKNDADFVIPVNISAFEKNDYKVKIDSSSCFEILKKRN